MSPPRLDSRASSQVATPAVLSANGRESSLATAPSGTRRARASSSRTSGGAGWLAAVPARGGCGQQFSLLLSEVVSVLECCTVTTPAPCRGWPAFGPGGLWPGPCLLTGVSAEAPGSSVTSRVRSPGTFACVCGLRSESCLTLEGRTRTLSGPFLELSSARHMDLIFRTRSVRPVDSTGCRCRSKIAAVGHPFALVNRRIL